jgi:hypothetical protein
LADKEPRKTKVKTKGRNPNFELTEIGELEIPEAGVHQIEFRLPENIKNPILIRRVLLEPVGKK